MNENQLNKNERLAKIQKYIHELIEKHKTDNTYFKSKRAMYKHFCQTYSEFSDTAESSFYRYLKNMNVQEIGSGKYDFVNTQKSAFHTLIDEKEYNHHLFFIIKKNSYRELITDLLNLKFNNYHFIVVQDTLICLFYYDKKNSNMESLNSTKRRIRSEIKDYLHKLSIFQTS